MPGVELKWPNDLVYRHLKVGGILVELNGDALGPSIVVVGVGLNVRLPAGDSPQHRAAGERPDDGCGPRRAARSIAITCWPVSHPSSPPTLDAYSRAGFPAFAAEWQRRHAYQGKPVKLLLPDGASVKGTVAGVDSTGALVLADGPRRARFLSGEISLRRVGLRPALPLT